MAAEHSVLTEVIEYSEETDFSHPDFSIDIVKSNLYENGVAVISNVISADDCDVYTGQLRDWLATFGDRFPINFNSLIHQYNISHIEPLWRARLQSKGLFTQLWGTEKLLSSMDSLAVGRPPEEGQVSFGEAISRHNLHLDQSRNRQGLHAYQGALYLEESLADDWCFVVMDNSNKHFSDFFNSHDSGRSEHRKLSADEIDWYAKRGCTIRRIAVPKGGMVLWDSRTVHAGAPPVQGRRNPGRWRFVLFICQTPASWATPNDLKLKRECYEQLKISFHWPSNGIQHFEYNKTKNDIMELPFIAKTHEARQLAGIEPYDFDDGASNGPKWKPKWKV